jgi:hypothetical protein
MIYDIFRPNYWGEAMSQWDFVADVVFDYMPRIHAAMTWLMVIALAPLACFRKTRPAAAIGFMIWLPTFAFMTWIESGAVIYLYWGLASAIFWSVLGAGVLTVLIAFGLTAIYGSSGDAFGFFVMIMALFGALLGFICTRADDR